MGLRDAGCAHPVQTRREGAALRAGLRVFVVVTANLGAEATVAILEQARTRMETAAVEEPAPFIYRIAKDASIRRIDA